MEGLSAADHPHEVVPARLRLGRESVAQLLDELGQIVFEAGRSGAARARRQHHLGVLGGVEVGGQEEGAQR